MNHLVVWVGFLSLKEKKIFLSRRGQHHSEPSPISTTLRDVISDAAVAQWLLGTNPNPQQRRSASAIQIVRVELDIEIGRRNNVGEIDCHSNVAGSVRSSDDAAIFVDELPKRQN